MRGGAPILRNGLLLIVLFLFPCLSPAQQETSTDPFTKADADINHAYKQALTKFAPANKEMLRRAERAWIDFSNKQEAVLNALHRENLLTEDAVNTATIAEVNERTNHLKIFFGGNSVPYAQPYILQNVDQKLSQAYGECMRRLGEDDQFLLREAERSWITYRDADSASTMTAYGNQTVQIAAAAHLCAIRVAQLTAMTNLQRQPVAPNPPIQESTPQNNSPNPDDVKSVAQFQDEAKGVLKELAAKKDDPFFKKSDAIKNASDLPLEIASHTSKLNSNFVGLSRKQGASKLLEPALNEVAAVSLLAGWSTFVRQLKSGDVYTAGTTIHDALSHKPKDVTPDYLPLWQTVQSWEDLFVKDEPKFHEHTAKAKALGDLGKTSDAIKEYQAAYSIIEASTIPDQIKKLREQSLGL